jgi:hypothetical protein
MTYATMSVVVTAQQMPEAVFDEAPAVLRSLPGDLGRYKGGTQVMFVLDEFGVPLPAVTRWLRGHGIRHDVEISYEWIDVAIGDDEGEDRYREDVEDIIDDFRHALCDSCGKDLSQHTIGPDPHGHPHLECAAIPPATEVEN